MNQVGNLARTPGNPPLFASSATGFFYDHSESILWFGVSSEGWHLLQCSHCTEAMEWDRFFDQREDRHLLTIIKTTSSSNLVFPGGLPSKYQPGPRLLSSVIPEAGQNYLDAEVLYCSQRVFGSADVNLNEPEKLNAMKSL